MDRRGFLRGMAGVLAAGLAPAVLSSGVIMPIRQLIVPGLILWGDGIHDDTAALQAFFDGKPVCSPGGIPFRGMMNNQTILVSATITINEDRQLLGGRIVKNSVIRFEDTVSPVLQINASRDNSWASVSGCYFVPI